MILTLLPHFSQIRGNLCLYYRHYRDGDTFAWSKHQRPWRTKAHTELNHIIWNHGCLLVKRSSTSSSLSSSSPGLDFLAHRLRGSLLDVTELLLVWLRCCRCPGFSDDAFLRRPNWIHNQSPRGYTHHTHTITRTHSHAHGQHNRTLTHRHAHVNHVPMRSHKHNHVQTQGKERRLPRWSEVLSPSISRHRPLTRSSALRRLTKRRQTPISSPIWLCDPIDQKNGQKSAL